MVEIEKLFYRYNPWWDSEAEITYKPREIQDTLFDSINDNKITVLTGLRRVGKTTLMKMTINHIRKNVKPTRILYLSLDNVGFSNISLNELVEKFRMIHKIPFKEKIYLFFDEVGYKENYEIELKNLFDMGNVKIFVSSSSTSILKSKVPFITGRTKTITILPLNFNEYLEFNNIKLKKEDQELYNSYLNEYLEFGGMPEYVLSKDPNILVELIDQIIFKDIIAFHGIKDEKIIKQLFRLLCERIGKPFTYNKLSKILGTSPETIKRYINLFEETYLFYQIERHSKSLNERIYSPKKIYIGDIGLKNITVGFKDKGSLYENLVYLKIKDKKPNYYYENETEIDFVYDNILLECKLGTNLTDKQKKVMDKSKRKTLIADSYKFLLK